MKLSQAISFIESQIDNPSQGLPQEIFYFISRLTPLINVDLLITNNNNQILLAWRNDKLAGSGWHIPGGIVRYKESMEDRIKEVARIEIGTTIQFNSEPIAIKQVLRNHKTRGHFISHLYQCCIEYEFNPSNVNRLESDAGYLAWHSQCPDNLIEAHEMYRPFILNAIK